MAHAHPITRTRCVEGGIRARATVVLAAWLLLVLATAVGGPGCAAGGGSEADEPVDPRALPVPLSDIPPVPTGEQTTSADLADAVMVRERLLEELRLIVTAIAGRETNATHPVLTALEASAEKVAEGIARLRSERAHHGLFFQQEISALIEGLEHHYAVIEAVRQHLDRLAATRPLATAGLASGFTTPRAPTRQAATTRDRPTQPGLDTPSEPEPNDRSDAPISERPIDTNRGGA